MSQYKAYPKYKDSGIEWIGQVPEHWEVKPLKSSVTYNDDVIPDSTDPEELINYVDISSVSYSEGISNVEEMAFVNAPSRARRKAKAGDVIVSTVRTYLKAVASVDEKFADCIFSTGFAVFRPRPDKLEPRFLKWLVLNDLFIQAIEAHSEGLSYPAINPPTLAALKTAIPGFDEQRKIAATLDRETARIDALIEKKTRFIELLKEKRQALITHAVTKGLDRNAKMKDSGVEWIGQVPEHWQIAPVKAISTTLNGATPESAKAEYWDGDIVWYTPTDIDNEAAKELGVPRRYISQAGFDNCAVRLAPPGSVVLSTRAPIGSVGITLVPSTTNQGCRTLVPTQSLPGKLLAFVLIAARDELRLRGNGTTFQELSTDSLRSMRIPLPPPNERNQIADHINHESDRIDALISKSEQSITLLKERRAAFITAAVTGQIDLRGEQLTAEAVTP